MLNTSSKKQVLLVAYSDLKSFTNYYCSNAQQKVKARLTIAIQNQGSTMQPAHEHNGAMNPHKGGIKIFCNLNPTQPNIVAKALVNPLYSNKFYNF